MIYELRIYHAMPGKLPALLKRFETATLKSWEKHGIRQIGFWTTYVGESSNDLYYILEWNDLGERQQKWDAFQSDPEWLKVKAETEKDGALYAHITNYFLKPTSFSKLK
jgi:NIPSNAP